LEAENFAGSGQFDGVDYGDYTVNIEHRYERGGKRQARFSFAESDQKIARLAAQRLRLGTIFEAQQPYIDVLAAAAYLDNAGDRLSLAEKLQATVGDRLRKARDPAVEFEISAGELRTRKNLPRQRPFPGLMLACR
jgi:cobalt-zinc-cadmium efflux system outer membrane protein